MKFIITIDKDIPHNSGMFYVVKEREGNYYTVLTTIEKDGTIRSPILLRKSICVECNINFNDDAYIKVMIERTKKLLAFSVEEDEDNFIITKYF